MKNEVEIKQYPFNNSIYGVIDEKLINWPVVYLINNEDCVYIGETSNIKNRVKQHLDSSKKFLNFINIVFDEKFNKSAILDIEQSLIRMFYADTKFDSTTGILNKNNGQSSKHNYYQREMYLNKLSEIWRKLKNSELVSKSYNEIVNSDIYKYSPFVSLTIDQEDIMCNIINDLLDVLEGKSDKCTSIVNGLAGTGKTILAINLIYNLANSDFSNIDVYKDDENFEDLSKYEKTMHRVRNYISTNEKIKIGFVVPMVSLRNTLKKVFQGINRKMLKDIIIAPGDAVKNDYDFILCDETHRLARYKNIPNMGNFKDNCKKLGLDEHNSTQLDWIMKKSKYRVLFYDENQTVKGSDIDSQKIHEIIEENFDKCYFLRTQLRCKSGENFLDKIQQLLQGTLVDKIESSKNFEIKLFNDPNEMIEKIKKLDEKMNLCRVVAGYDWEWISKDKTLNEIEENDLYDFKFGDKKYIWNKVNNGWILTDNAVNEIGCVHTVQGYDLNYVGVIIGPDITYDAENKKITININELKDKNVKRGIEENQVKEYVINTYRVLLSRGIHGCYIYACDENLRNYFKQFIEEYNDVSKYEIDDTNIELMVAEE